MRQKLPSRSRCFSAKSSDISKWSFISVLGVGAGPPPDFNPSLLEPLGHAYSGQGPPALAGSNAVRELMIVMRKKQLRVLFFLMQLLRLSAGGRAVCGVWRPLRLRRGPTLRPATVCAQSAGSSRYHCRQWVHPGRRRGLWLRYAGYSSCYSWLVQDLGAVILNEGITASMRGVIV